MNEEGKKENVTKISDKGHSFIKIQEDLKFANFFLL